jgi:outer membrane protein assembly factor BamE (lipoprotein component of BamABCDE complex)
MKTTKSTLLAAAALTLSVLAGCATGNTSLTDETPTTLQQKLVKGKTTKADVIAQFGEPSERGADSGKEYWAYQMAASSAKTFIPFASAVTGSSGIAGKYLRIYFNKKGVVDSYDLNETKI